MSLDQLLHEVSVHYRDRGLPESALLHLRWTLITNTKDGYINIFTAYPKCLLKVAELIGRFNPCPQQSYSSINTASAVFGFAFGYRMKSWTKGLNPQEDFANRIPGNNNAALADRAIYLHQQHKLPLYMQIEISDAIDGRVPVVCRSCPKDQNTIAVADEFIKHALSSNVNIGNVVLLAHKHHYDRCRIVLEGKGITCLPAWPTEEAYSGYDPQEAQPRVMSPEEQIINDFVSMATMKLS